MKLDEKYIDACEKLGWTVKEYDDGTINISQYSPAGEDFSFEVDSVEDFAERVREYAAEFNIDEHIEMWIRAKGNGRTGIPSARELVHDAEAIDKMLQDLAAAVSEVEG